MASSVWKGQLTFGLVSVPVRLLRAARRERMQMHYVAPAEEPPPPRPRKASLFEVARSEPTPAPVARVTQTLLSPDDKAPIASKDLLRGHEVAPDRYVTFTQRELRALRPETSSEMQIVRTVKLEEIDPVYLETSYYVIADRGGERAYSLLFAALKETGFVALASVAMHGREHVVVIRPGHKGLLAHTMFYSDEIRADNEFEANTSKLGPKELQLARTFIEAIAGPFAPEEFKDTHREKLRELIAGKLEDDEVSSGAEKPEPATIKTIDIMEALRKSIKKTKETAETVEPVARREPGKATQSEKRPRRRKA